MNQSNIYFLGGIHGVGKGTFCERFCSKTGFRYLSASKLIGWEEMSEETQGTKAVRDIDNTQFILIQELEKRCFQHENYILDGHYCLLNENKTPTPIPYEIFEMIRPSYLMLLTQEIEVVKSRLEKRDNVAYDYHLLENMQIMEANHAKNLAARLNVPLIEIEHESSDQIINQFKTLNL